ncbi:MAG: lipocalin-like domain-containing protein [Planctomycetota bacterium]
MTRLLGAALAIWTTILLSGCTPPPTDENLGGAVPKIFSGDPDPRYTRASPAVALRFPHDHGPHEDHQVEWWYFTGNLQDQNGRRFGFELTFFRVAQAPPGSSSVAASASTWRTRQTYLAHFAVTDVASGQFHAFERVARGAAGLAGCTTEPFRVWTESWSVQSTGQSFLPLRLHAADNGVAIELELTSEKGRVLQGEAGYSAKGSKPGQASHYYSYPRLTARGSVTVGDKQHKIAGRAWLDREWSTSVLDDELVGWDWFALQLSDGRDVMVYHLRRADGSIDPFSAGVVIEGDGSSRKLTASQFELEATGRWKSPETGITYPSGWRIIVPSAGLELQVTPALPGQELRLGTIYWEGAVDVTSLASTGESDEELSGVGYVELVGYGE